MKFLFPIGSRERREFFKQANAVKSDKKKVIVKLKSEFASFVEIEFVDKEEEETEE